MPSRHNQAQIWHDALVLRAQQSERAYEGTTKGVRCKYLGYHDGVQYHQDLDMSSLANSGRWKDTELNYGVALHPYFEGGKVVTGCNSWHIGLWNHSKQKDDAAKFVRYLTASPKVALGYVDDYGQVPAHNSAILHVSEDPKFNNFPDIVMCFQLFSWPDCDHVELATKRTCSFFVVFLITLSYFNVLCPSTFNKVSKGNSTQKHVIPSMRTHNITHS